MTELVWGTVSTVLEPPQILLSFVAHHLQAGAGVMHLYLDQPIPEFQAQVRGKDRVRVTVCDDAYWQSQHNRPRPEDSRYRQVLNANHAYRQAGCDWLAHIDADEFLIRVPLLKAFLARQPTSVQAVSVSNAERVHLCRPWGVPAQKTVFDGLFRKPFDGGDTDRIAKVYGKGAEYLQRGFSGYPIGKTLFRTGAGLRVDIHQPGPREAWQSGVNPARRWFSRIGLLHVDGFTRAHWERKMRKRLDAQSGQPKVRQNPARGRQAEVFTSAVTGGPDVDWLFRATRTVTLVQAARLLRYRKLAPVRLDVSAALAAEFPGLDVDLSPAAIDAALAEQESGRG
ncbi:glycosyltransferase family 2 protein [Tropicibacter oceani]|uniref:Glycosyltransferase family 2 protein n=1 Tax=Tropicibacter oceani TaxID=3058420 RepID=A0ABY8QH06_9RHOB|nr:glycosyltransferase family 2 protein [Tropicibacter oceani]WGW03922.1 glycosyltransferase family 2 protein [Tropicibacter oceani]